MSVRNITHTATFRITGYYVLCFIGGLLLLSALSYFAGTSIWEKSLRDEIAEEASHFKTQATKTGVQSLPDYVASRAEEMADDGFAYLLLDPEGHKKAGRLNPEDAAIGAFELLPDWGEEDEPYFAFGRILPDGWQIIVARDVEVLYETREFIWEGLAWTFAIALPLSLIGGLIVSALILRRLERINRATHEIRQGQLANRIPMSGRNDEFDRLTSHLNDMLDGIEGLTEGVRQVSNHIAHDLRTPLTRVSNLVEAARGKQLSPTEFAATLDTIQGELDGLLQAFSAMLRIARLDSSSNGLEIAPLEISNLLIELADDFEPIAEEAGIALSVDIAPSLSVNGDRNLIVQAIVNIVENAIHHSSGDKITISGKATNNHIDITIADNGVGISSSEQDNVFQRFYSLDKSRQDAGFGLGLSLVAAAAKRLGFQVMLDDNQPGLIVILRFPKTSE